MGHLVSKYNVVGRENLTDEHVEKIFRHFSEYFQRAPHPFFNPFIQVLNNLIVNGNVCTFQNGGICAVDVIKCPTVGAFTGFVMTDEGKKVWHNCLGRVNNVGPNHFILEQIRKHAPPILIFAQSTSGLIGVAYKGNGNGTLPGFGNMKIFTLNQQSKRLSIDLGSNRGLQIYLGQNINNSHALHNAIQIAINNFF